MWNCFVTLSLILSQSELLGEEFEKLTQAFWREILTLPFFPAYQFYFYISQPIRLDYFEKFIFELESSSYSFKSHFNSVKAGNISQENGEVISKIY